MVVNSSNLLLIVRLPLLYLTLGDLVVVNSSNLLLIIRLPLKYMYKILHRHTRMLENFHNVMHGCALNGNHSMFDDYCGISVFLYSTSVNCSCVCGE